MPSKKINVSSGTLIGGKDVFDNPVIYLKFLLVAHKGEGIDSWMGG